MSGVRQPARGRVIGTAGHVDHGKTRLIHALTGIDADRLPEEKRRGMTIDLGFAYFGGAAGPPVGVVDVPGHERFIRNMVAGAWGLDLALLVVAADDGWMQQSEDHTSVLAGLGVPRLILVITKSDLAEAAAVEEVRRRSLARLRLYGYPAPPSLEVSAPAGRNIEALRGLILSELARLEPEPEAPPCLYVDRVFTVPGAGTVVTGTLREGPLESGQELRLYPAGRRLRVRGLEAYYETRQRVLPTSRVAVNLAGGEGVRRGDLLSTEDSDFQAVGEFIAGLDGPASGAAAFSAARTGGLAPEEIKNQMEVEVALGTAHTRARLHLLPGGDGPGLARFLLHEPLAARWGQRFLLIRRGGSAILGAGRILHAGASTRAERQRLLPVLRALPPSGGPEARLTLDLELAGCARWDRYLSRAPEPGPDRVLEGPWLFARPRLAALEAEIKALAGSGGGITFAELSGKIRLPEEPLRVVTRRLCEAGTLRLSRNVLLRGDAAPGLSPLGNKLLRDLRAAGREGLEVKKLTFAGARKELRNLARLELAVSLDGNIYLARETYLELTGIILEGLEVQARFGIQRAKERAGLSRKYILPLLNRLELDGFVKREGDLREVLKPPPA